MYAVIENGGKQYKVSEGDVLRLEKIETKVGSLVEDSKVLLVSDGKETKIGTPVVDGAKVTLKVTDHGKGEKIIVYKMKPKKGYRRKQGHRQPYTEVTVEKIQG
ncbi:50S ribosomal protein L21 [endosymbiont 'TC1' of Trimyema compressum]|uniref:50S ribosomal protein L21 n=1 Tax=endosymbiont 'TC1' of Trimyema compressum TaxID=243899 RepID=UPI0007F0CE74|nr:50S ribosomal protein L21 [endosymbiont 'TC1' of Trimyema compressum]AMP20751.1 50S ribosomal protein L21 [endosymbiont 'TC1' of Trimyema compressum]